MTHRHHRAPCCICCQLAMAGQADARLLLGMLQWVSSDVGRMHLQQSFSTMLFPLLICWSFLQKWRSSACSELSTVKHHPLSDQIKKIIGGPAFWFGHQLSQISMAPFSQISMPESGQSYFKQGNGAICFDTRKTTKTLGHPSHCSPWLSRC